mmetsp:Transcript_21898/g.31910  ORF Transcript_21898/g.31910 Transcript_21898/m.31910 type:complete len:1146 (-) Transcript_21898:123-3560(-)
MIEPLRYHIEKSPPHAIPAAVFCQRCLGNKKTRNNPGLVIKYCQQCQRCNYLCKECDEYAHSFVKTKDHVRRIVVIGPAVRKKIQIRGDSRSFPKLFDIVEIKVKSRVIHNGKTVHREPVQYVKFPSGVSGTCVHVQILGAKRLPIADAHGSSDPFVCLQFGGKRVGTTRTRPRTINPRWNNETFVVPCEIDAVHKIKKGDDILKMEVFDRDYFNFNDFLGHVEITRPQLLKLANVSNQKPIRLNLSLREYHGRLGVQFGINANICYLKIVRAESLDKMDAIGLSDPFCEVIFLGRSMGRTKVIDNTCDPEWTSGNVFTFRVEDVLTEELRLRQLGQLNRPNSRRQRKEGSLDAMHLFQINLYDHNRFRKHGDLGSIKISVEQFRKLAPSFPKSFSEIEAGKALNHFFIGGANIFVKKIRSTRLSISSGQSTPSVEKDEIIAKSNSSTSSHEELGIHDPIEEASHGESMDSSSVISAAENSLRQQSQVGSISDSIVESQVNSEGESRRGSQIESQSESHRGNQSISEGSRDDVEEKDFESVTIQDATEDLFGDENVYLPGEDDELQRPEPKEPVFEYETENMIEEDGSEGDVDQSDVPAWRRWEGGSETSASSRSKSVPPLVMEDRSLLENAGEEISESEEEDELSSSRDQFASKKISSEQSDSGLCTEQSLQDTHPEYFERTERGVTPRIDHDLHVSDDEDDETRENEESYTAAAQDISQESDVATFIEEEMDPEKPKSALVSKMVSGLSAIGNFAQTQWGQLFPTDGSRPSSSRRQSVAEVIHKQRQTVLSATVGVTQWFPLKYFDVQKQVDENIADVHQKDRGQLIVRLIPSRRGHVVRGLDVGVRHMTLGETSTIKVRYDFAYGNYWMGPTVPPRSNINFTVQLLSINGSGGVFQMPWRQFLRFYRLLRRTARMCRLGCIKCVFHTVQCAKATKRSWEKFREKKTDEEIESFIDDDEEEDMDTYITEEEMKESSSSSEEEFVLTEKNRAIVVGAGAMWGYNPKARKKKPKKNKKSKEERLKEKLERKRLARLALMESQKSSRSSRSQRSTPSRKSAGHNIPEDNDDADFDVAYELENDHVSVTSSSSNPTTKSSVPAPTRRIQRETSMPPSGRRSSTSGGPGRRGSALVNRRRSSVSQHSR